MRDRPTARTVTRRRVGWNDDQPVMPETAAHRVLSWTRGRSEAQTVRWMVNTLRVGSKSQCQALLREARESAASHDELRRKHSR